MGKNYIREITFSDDLRILTDRDRMTVEMALNVPAVSACAEFISGTVAMLPIHLYRRTGDGVEQVFDERWRLLNQSSQDTLDIYQQRKRLVSDYLLKGAGYLYIERNGNLVRSLRYVDAGSVSVSVSPDAIFRDVTIYVSGRRYMDFEFVHIARNSPDGWSGTSVVEDGAEIIKAAYNSIKLESKVAKSGGNRKGVLMADKTVGERVMANIKESWKRLWNNGGDNDNTIVLENGVQFKETSSTFADLQLSELKSENSKELCKLFCVPPTVISGEASADSYTSGIRTAIMPVVEALTAALNANLLLESEKGEYYWEIDTSELLKGDILKRYQAYAIALKSNFMLLDEVRERENLPDFGEDFISLNLSNVLYFPKTKEIYTPNTNVLAQLGKGGMRIDSERAFAEGDHPRTEDGKFDFKEKGVANSGESGKMKVETPEAYHKRVPEATEKQYQQYCKVHEAGITGEIRVPAEQYDASNAEFRDAHGSHHGVTLERARSYVEKAKFSFSRKRWDGTHKHFFSKNGATYIDENGKIKTSFPKEKYDDNAQKAMEVFEDENSDVSGNG